MVKHKNCASGQKVSYTLCQRIIKLLIENKRAWTILEISLELKSDYKNTFQAVNKLCPDLIVKNKKGNLNLIEINITPDIRIYDIEKKRAEEFLSANPKIRLIKEDIDKLNYPFFIVLLFGSVIKGNATEKSDVDVCIISDSTDKTKEAITNFKLLPQNIEVQSFTAKEFESMLNKKEDNLAKEIVKKNVILFGIENYYALVSKWMKKE